MLRRLTMVALLIAGALFATAATAQAHHVNSEAECVLVDNKPVLKLTADFIGFSSTHDVNGKVYVDDVKKFDGAVPVTWTDDNGTWVWTQPAEAGKTYKVKTEWSWDGGSDWEKHYTDKCPSPAPVPGIDLVKTGPSTANAGDTVTYFFAVKNTGNVTLTLGAIADDKCSSTPVRKAGETDTSFDPGDTFNFSCTYVVPAGVTSVHNTATVCGEYPPPQGPPMKVCDTDDHEFPVPPPSTPLVPPQGGGTTTPTGGGGTTTPPAGGGGAVLPETIVSGRAGLRGPSGCVYQAFTARVVGRRIARVRFYVDGRLVKTISDRRRVYTAKIRPRGLGLGRHRVVARVRFVAASRTDVAHAAADVPPLRPPDGPAALHRLRSARASAASRHSRTKAPRRRSASSSSGCQRTPSMKRLPASSTASTVPSVSARAVARRPSPIAGDALVVVALDGDAGRAGRDRGEAVGIDVDAVVGELAGLAAVDVVLEPVRQVLLERAAVGDVDDLHAAADAEAREVPLGRLAHEQQLEVVAVARRGVGLLVRLLAVRGRVDVGAAGDEHAVEQVEQLRRVLEVGGGRRDQQRAAAGAGDRAHVGERHHRGGLGPDAVLHDLEVAGHADVGGRAFVGVAHRADYGERAPRSFRASTRAADSSTRSRNAASAPARSSSRR